MKEVGSRQTAVGSQNPRRASVSFHTRAHSAFCLPLNAYCLLPTAYFLLPTALFALFLFSSCKREERGFKMEAAAAGRAGGASRSELRPGGAEPPAGVTDGQAVKSEYEKNAYAMNEGKRLYEWFNCVGCHAHGGGGIGPPLMDDKWLYGSRPEQVFQTIVEGRLNGMPSFRGRIPDYQVWQLAAYVRSMSGQAPKDAAPGRSDDINATKPEQRKGTEVPRTDPPKPAEAPK